MPPREPRVADAGSMGQAAAAWGGSDADKSPRAAKSFSVLWRLAVPITQMCSGHGMRLTAQFARLIRFAWLLVGEMGSRSLLAPAWAGLFVVLMADVLSAQPLLTVSDSKGESTVTMGVFSQPTVDWEKIGDGAMAGSVYVRRLRVIAGGNATRKLRFFLDSDTPNLGREINGERQHTTYLQDLIVTYAERDEFQIDAGMLMVPVSYNSLQSAASLLSVAYGPYSFVSSAPTTSKVGRDQGVQARGYLIRKHLEYRAGAFRGIREIDPGAPLRTTVRVAWHAFEPQTNFFYAGTTHGKKKLLVVGASLDRQDRYSSAAVDALYETPVRERDAVTLQVDAIHYDGGARLRQIPRQNTLLIESGYTWGRWRLGVFGQASWQRVTSGPDAANWQVGGAWWLHGHRANVKAGVGRSTRDLSPAHTQVVVQTQVFAF